MINKYNSPKVSVIIPSFNMANYISECIRSVLSGTFDPVEVWVIDDGSDDNTEAIVSKFTNKSSPYYDPRVHYKYQSNTGKPGAVNYAMSLVQSDYIAVVDADDQLPPDSLSLRYDAIQKSNGSCKQMAVGEFEVFDQEGDIVGHRKLPSITDSTSLYKRFYLAYKSPFHMNACLMSRCLCESVGLFDTQLQRCQDIDYSLRLLREVDQIAWVDTPVYRYRKHRNSPIERIQLRGKTLIHRPLVYWKNYEGWKRCASVATGLVIDIGKLIYEIKGNYHG